MEFSRCHNKEVHRCCRIKIWTKIDRNGNSNVKIGFSEPRSDGESNAMIATVIEYGKHGQPPKPFMEPAKAESKNECKKVMKAVLEREVAKL